MRFLFGVFFPSLFCVLMAHEGASPLLSRYGQTKIDPNKPYVFVNPNAPKGGTLKLSASGTFDSLNKDIVKGNMAEGLLLTFDPLMRRIPGEPFTIQGVLAKTVVLAKDYSSITITLHPLAAFHDGAQVTSTDVQYTIETLRDKWLPRYKTFYSRISKFEIVDEKTFKISFQPIEDGSYDPELPLIVASLRVLSKAQLEKIDFMNSGMTPIIGSGPYKVASFEQGRQIVYERHPNYWGKDLICNQGMFNFDRIQIDYYKNAEAQLQAFGAGEFDFYSIPELVTYEKIAKQNLVTSQKTKLVKEEHQRPVTVRTIIFNMRRAIFQDIRVRKALELAFDRDTLNKVSFQNSFLVPHSLFANTPLAHTGEAKGKELEILMPYIKDLPKGTLQEVFSPTRTKGDGDQREYLQKADLLLKEAGWGINDKGKRVNDKGEVFRIEFIVKDPKFEKIALAYQRSLALIGIELAVRLVDTVQYENRAINHDFDMIIHSWSNSLSPGNEQGYYFSAKAADMPGSSNYIGVKNPIIEELAKKVAASKTQEDLMASVHALDRVVMHHYYLIPFAYDNIQMYALRQDRIAIPEPLKDVGLNVMEWGWFCPHSCEKNTPSLWEKTQDWVKSWFA